MKQAMLTNTNELLYRCKLGEEYFTAWKELNEGFNEYNKAVGIASDFFAVVNEALLNSMMMELSKLYDSHRDAITLRKLFEQCKAADILAEQEGTAGKEKASFKVAFQNMGNYLEGENEKSKLLTALKTRRDKYYMHSDPKYFQNIQGLVEDSPLYFGEIEELFNAARCFCEALYELLSGTQWKPQLHQGCLVHKRDFSGLKKLLATAERNGS